MLYHWATANQLPSNKSNLPFVFCGLDGPIELNDSIDQEALRISKLIVQKFKLRGFNGIDFLVSDKAVHFLDLNPRITASFEILQESHSFCFFEKHIHLTRDIPGNTYVPESFSSHEKKNNFWISDYICRIRFLYE